MFAKILLSSVVAVVLSQYIVPPSVPQPLPRLVSSNQMQQYGQYQNVYQPQPCSRQGYQPFPSNKLYPGNNAVQKPGGVPTGKSKGWAQLKKSLYAPSAPVNGTTTKPNLASLLFQQGLAPQPNSTTNAFPNTTDPSVYLRNKFISNERLVNTLMGTSDIEEW